MYKWTRHHQIQEIVDKLLECRFANFIGTFKGCVRFVFASLKESTCETWENVFYFDLKAFFICEKIKFQHFRYQISYYQTPKLKARNTFY